MAAGLGYFDPQGVWRYGEDDTEVLFSDLLDKGQASLSAALALDRSRLGTLETRVSDFVVVSASLAVPHANEQTITTWAVAAGIAAWRNAGKITPTRAGWYELTIAGRWDASPTGIRLFRMSKNGAAIVGGVCEKYMPTAADTNGLDARTSQVYLNGTTDYVSVGVYATAGGAIGAYPQFTVRRVS